MWNGPTLVCASEVTSLLQADGGPLAPNAELGSTLLDILLFANVPSARAYIAPLFRDAATGKLSLQKAGNVMARLLLVDGHAWNAWSPLILENKNSFKESVALFGFVREALNENPNLTKEKYPLPRTTHTTSHFSLQPLSSPSSPVCTATPSPRASVFVLHSHPLLLRVTSLCGGIDALSKHLDKVLGGEFYVNKKRVKVPFRCYSL